MKSPLSVPFTDGRTVTVDRDRVVWVLDAVDPDLTDSCYVRLDGDGGLLTVAMTREKFLEALEYRFK